MNELFQEELIAAAKNKQNFGDLPEADNEAKSFNVSCGDRIAVKVKYSQDKKKIADLKWTGNGCIISQAAMSKLSEVVIGQDISEVSQMSMEDVMELLKLSNITPGRTRCLILGLSTLQSALNSQQ